MWAERSSSGDETLRMAATMAVKSCIDGGATPLRLTARRFGGGERVLGTDFFDADRLVSQCESLSAMYGEEKNFEGEVD